MRKRDWKTINLKVFFLMLLILSTIFYCYTNDSYASDIEAANLINMVKNSYIKGDYPNIPFYKAIEKYNIVNVSSFIWRTNRVSNEETQVLLITDINIGKVKFLTKQNTLYNFQNIRVTNAKLYISWIIKQNKNIKLNSFLVIGSFIRNKKIQEYNTLAGFGDNNSEFYKDIIKDIYDNSPITIAKIMLTWNIMKSDQEETNETEF